MLWLMGRLRMLRSIIVPVFYTLQLSAIDASPLLLKVVNCPAVKFDYSINFGRLRAAAMALLEEYPIIGGRCVAEATTGNMAATKIDSMVE